MFKDFDTSLEIYFNIHKGLGRDTEETKPCLQDLRCLYNSWELQNDVKICFKAGLGKLCWPILPASRVCKLTFTGTQPHSLV